MFAKLFYLKYYHKLSMNPIQISTILIGNWNPRIFTPSWIKTNLFNLSKETEIEGLVNFDDLDFAFKYNDIVIIPKFSSVEISFEKYEYNISILAANIVLKILELLPQTPIKAMGVNIRYVYSNKDEANIVQAINSIKSNFSDFTINQLSLIHI